MLRESVTYVLDRGYLAFALLRDSIAAHAHVIMRACNTIVVETIEELTVASLNGREWEAQYPKGRGEYTQ